MNACGSASCCLEAIRTEAQCLLLFQTDMVSRLCALKQPFPKVAPFPCQCHDRMHMTHLQLWVWVVTVQQGSIRPLLMLAYLVRCIEVKVQLHVFVAPLLSSAISVQHQLRYQLHQQYLVWVIVNYLFLYEFFTWDLH